MQKDWGVWLVGKFRPGVQGRYGRRQPLVRRIADSRHLLSGPMRARDRLLLFVALDGAPEGLDPVRLQKGMFLFAQDPSVSSDETYEFVPYNYGPMSSQIYKDLETLIEDGLIEAVPVSGQSWARYLPTEKGLLQARKLLRDEPSQRGARCLHAIKQDVASKTFSAVLEDVYDRYPEYATNSVFRRAS